MVWACIGPLSYNCFECSMRYLEVCRRRKNQLAIRFGFELLHPLCNSDLISVDKSFGHPCTAIFTDNSLRWEWK